MTRIVTVRSRPFVACMTVGWMAAAVPAMSQVARDTLPEVAVMAPADARTPRLSAASTAPQMGMSGHQMLHLGLASAADVLKQMGGVAVRDYGGLGGMKTVSVRGLGAQHTAICYDGLPVSNCQAGQIDLSRFPTGNLSHLSLFVGTSDDLLAPAMTGAYSGGVNLRTDWERTAVRVAYGSWNTIEAAASACATPRRAPQGACLAARLLYQHTDGNYPFTLANGQTRERLRRHNGRVDATSAEVNWRMGKDGAWRWESKAYAYYSDRQLPGTVIYYVNRGTERLWDENVAVQSRLVRQWSDRWQAVAGIKYNHAWNKYRDRTAATSADTYRQEEGFATGAVRLHPHKAWNVALAHDEQWAVLHSSFAESPRHDRWTTWTSLRAQYHIVPLTLQGAYMLTTTSDGQRQWTPSFSSSWQPTARLPLRLRALWRKAFRLPNFNDLYYYRLGNHSLRPERADEAGVGVTFTASGTSEDTRVVVTADAYVNRVADKIVAYPTTFVWKMANFGRVRIRGLDVGLTADCPIRRARLHADAHYTLQEATDHTTPQASTYGHQLPYTPRHSGSAAATLSMSPFTLGYLLTWQGERHSNIMATDRYRLPSYAEHSLTLTYHRSVHRHPLELTASVLNIADRQYAVVQYYPMPGRTLRLAARLALR